MAGSWRYLGRAEGRKNRAATPRRPRSRHYTPILGTAFVHTVIDDHSRTRGVPERVEVDAGEPGALGSVEPAQGVERLEGDLRSPS
jgi:hypothetical protein